MCAGLNNVCVHASWHACLCVKYRATHRSIVRNEAAIYTILNRSIQRRSYADSNHTALNTESVKNVKVINGYTKVQSNAVQSNVI